MTDIRYLHNESAKMRRKMQAKLNEADRSTQKAESYNKAGVFERAAAESENAARLYNEAMQLEHDAMECDRRAAEMEIKAAELERQEIELQTKTREKIDIIERLKRALRGDY